MSKKDNLTDFLKDVANTIRTNDGTSDAINPQDFSTKISNTVGSNITKRSSSDLSYSNYTLNVPAGYYKDKATLSATYTYSTDIKSLYPNKSSYTQTIWLDRLYKNCKITVLSNTLADTVLSYRSSLVATITNVGEIPSSVTLSPNRAYILEWNVMDSYHSCIDGSIPLQIGTNLIYVTDLWELPDDGEYMSVENTFYMLLYFDSAATRYRLRCIKDDWGFSPIYGCLEVAANQICTSSNYCVTINNSKADAISSEQYLYIYSVSLAL